MANENVAAINCTMQITGTVRKKGKGRYPYYLYTDKFGPQFFNTPEGQEFLIGHMEEIGTGTPPWPPVETKPAAAEKPEPEAAPEVKKSWLDGL